MTTLTLEYPNEQHILIQDPVIEIFDDDNNLGIYDRGYIKLLCARFDDDPNHWYGWYDKYLTEEV